MTRLDPLLPDRESFASPIHVSALPHPDTIPSGLHALDQALGLDGLPRGHMVELLGTPQSGKTTLCLDIASQVLAQGGTVAFLDASHQLDVLAQAGLPPRFRDLLVNQCNELEESLEIARILVSHQAVDLVVLDPVSSLVPRAELDAPMHSGGVGTPSVRLLEAIHRLNQLLSRSKCCLLVVDVLRECDDYPPGTMETTAVTRTLTPFSAIRLQLQVDRARQRASTRLLHVVKNRLGNAGAILAVPPSNLWDASHPGLLNG